MTGDDGDGGGPTKAELRAELRRSRSRLRSMEAELTETNEGMIALTLELENAKERYQTIFEESTDGILLIDPDENAIHEANPRVCALLGYDRDVLVELSPADIFPYESDRIPTFAEAVVQGWAQGFTCRTKDGRNVDVDISASVVTLDNKSLLLASLRDVTERNRRKQRLQVLTRIFRHNLRNDGNVIQGHADLLADELSNSALQVRAEQIRRTIDKVMELSGKVRRTEDVLDRSRLQWSSLRDILEYQQESFEQTYPEDTLDITLPASDLAVARRLNVAIEEVIDNAARHSESAVTVRIGVEVNDADERLAIVIRDDGPGIAEHELRAVRTGGESPLTHGSGIGLWLVFWVVDSLGGELKVHEREHGGTRVSILVPLATAERMQERWTENLGT